MITANAIRRKFLDYFVAHDHKEVASSALVPRNDPTLMFANSGMVQFKNLFTGIEERDYKRATTAQKCVRAGGKHNDLENVGYTARHHTFFEMLGNFSFGDYFKEQAIFHAWELVTKEFDLPKDRLLVTIFADDDEAYSLWKKIAGLGDDRIIRINSSDNFWQMGETGPCGPCSEIFYDHGEHIKGGPPGSADEDGDRFIEIWNLVFMQYEQMSAGQRQALPKPSIDTGMGLERMTAILQNVHDNYDIDLMRAIIDAVADLTSVAPTRDKGVAHKVIADHLRASAFLIADGVLPSNEGRGYVLRRIMRRAMRYGHYLGVKEPLLYRLLPSLVNVMGDHYQELGRASALIHETLKLEEERFITTLDRGMKRLNAEIDRLGEGQRLDGKFAFSLYDQDGFPLDLTTDILRRQGLDIDQDGFKQAMDEQRKRARMAWAGSGDEGLNDLWYEIKDKIGGTEFLGYHSHNGEGQIMALIKDGKITSEITKGDEAILITNQTPFYGESGGQAGDKGYISSFDGQQKLADFKVSDTKKQLENLILHYGKVETGSFATDSFVNLQIDNERRNKLRANHSVTHLVHKALRVHLGDHVTQKGSLVEEKSMRFDFSHPKSLNDEQIQVIEDDVNREIRNNLYVKTSLMDQDTAIKNGALALFGEKYGDEVRVVSMTSDDGEKLGEGSKIPYSVELCGGTHVKRTGDIGLFKILSEQGVAAGVRRIECVTGKAAFDYLRGQEQTSKQTANLLKTLPEQLADRVSQLIQDRKRLERELASLKQKIVVMGDATRTDEDKNEGQFITAKDGKEIQLITRHLNDISPKEIKPMVDALKQQIDTGIILIAANNDGKASLVVGITDDIKDQFDAVAIVRSLAPLIGGKGGGGRADMAQAGGSAGDQIPQMLSQSQEIISTLSL